MTAVHHPQLFAHCLELDLENWNRVIDINLTSLFICSQKVARYMVRRDIQGRIINIASTASFGADLGGANYVAAKHGVMGLTRSMAVELGSHKIIVNAIAPGMTETEGARPSSGGAQTDRNREVGAVESGGHAEEVASAAVFLRRTSAPTSTGRRSWSTGASWPTSGGGIDRGGESLSELRLEPLRRPFEVLDAKVVRVVRTVDDEPLRQTLFLVHRPNHFDEPVHARTGHVLVAQGRQHHQGPGSDGGGDDLGWSKYLSMWGM